MLTGFMHLMSFIGSAAFYVPLLVAVFWCVSPRTGARMAVILTFGAVLNTVLKLVFHAPRPYWTDPSVTGHEAIDSFGMPSGHAQNGMLAYGFLGSLTRRRAVWAAAAMIIVLVGVSRVYLGVHSPGQVLAGWAIGLAVLVAALGLEPVLVPWWTRRPIGVQLALALAVSMAFLVGAQTALDDLRDWTWPAAWAREISAAGGAVQPPALGQSAAGAGGLFGLVAGLSLLARRGWFRPADAVWRRLAALVVGVAGALAIYTFGLFLGTQPVQAFAVQALLGLWTAAGAPETFVRLRLAPRPTPAITRAGERFAGLRQ